MKKNIIRQAPIKKSLIVGNWKMNPDTIREAKELLLATRKTAKQLKNIRVILCPPFVFLSDLEKLINNNEISLGAQDVFWENAGSYTGEISPTMLRGEGFVIIGHSERRELGETDEIIAKKVNSAIKAGLKPILCIGEKERDEHGEYLHFLRQQITNSLKGLIKKNLSDLIIAYEPIWAIGKTDNEAMKPADVHEMTIFIKKVLVEIYGPKTKIAVPVLYGGSVSHKNAKDLINFGEVQGLLIGRESLNHRKFSELLKSLE